MTNLVILSGRLGSDPEIRTTQAGKKVATVSLATSKPRRDSEGQIMKDDDGRVMENTEWHRVTMFNGLAGLAEKTLRKGMKVHLTGDLHYSSYEKDGEKRYATEIRVDQLDILTWPKED
jgi:single-strand DNA-binding protein